MKKILSIFAIILFYSFTAKATHLLGGDFKVTMTNNGASSSDYDIQLRLYRDDVNGVVNMPASVTIGIYQLGTNNLQTLKTLYLNGGSASLVPLGDSCYTPNPSVIRIEEGVYSGLGSVSLPNFSMGYYLHYETCCRNGLIDNLANPTSAGISIFAIIPDPALGQNSSPDFGNYPNDAYFCLNSTNSFIWPVTDPDGDSLVFSLVAPLNDGDNPNNGNSAPGSGAYPFYPTCIYAAGYSPISLGPGTPPFTINSLTGEITGSPAIIGNFVFAVRVEEYRNGVKIGEVRRDVQYAVVPFCSINNVFSTDYQYACNSYTWIDGNTYYSNNNSATYIFSDTINCYDSIIKLNLTVSSLDLGPDTNLCFGNSYFLDAGSGFNTYLWDDSSVNATRLVTNPGVYYVTASLNSLDSVFFDTITYLPDGSGTNYATDITISGFLPGATIQNPNDIEKMCVKMEHSYLGDLEMKLTCPSGQSVNIFNSSTVAGGLFPGGFGGGNDYLGGAFDNNTGIVGVCEQYCFSNSNNAMPSFANGYNTTTASGPSPNQMVVPGLYEPEVSFLPALSGCPVNGTWTLTVRDNFAIDDGFICEWGIYFSSNRCNVSDTVIINSFYGIDTISSCNSYTWIDGITYSNSNYTATDTILSLSGCDSVITLNLTILPNQFGTDFTANQLLFTSLPFVAQFTNNTPNPSNYNFTWDFGDGTILQSNNTNVFHDFLYDGLYSVSLIAQNINTGCTDTMYKQDYVYTTGGSCINSGIDIQNACDSYTWIDGNTYNSSNNTATVTLTNAAGCDSVVTLNLTINQTSSSIDNQILCDGNTLNWIDGNTYTSSNNTATYTLTNSDGCDSIVSLNLTVSSSTSTLLTISSCGSYIFNGQSLSTTGIYVDTNLNAAGCPQIDSLDLTITTVGTTTVQSSCDNFLWNGTTYDTSGIYTSNSSGNCVDTLVLTISEFLTNFTASPTLITSPPFNVTFNNTTPNISNYDFTWDLGDGTIGQTNIPSFVHQYMSNGIYDVSLIAEDIINNCGYDTLKFDNLISCSGGSGTSINEKQQLVNIFPNPTKENISIRVNNFIGNIQTEVYDLLGHRLQTTNETTISLRDYARGIYLLKVAYGDRVDEVKVIKD